MRISRRGASVLSILGLAIGMSANRAHAVTSLFFDVDGSNPGFGITDGSSYSWDDDNWTTDSTGSSDSFGWIPGAFARFGGGTNPTSYTVTVNADEQVAGWFETVNGVNLTLNASGSGTLDLASGLQGVLNGGGSSTMTVNAPISGPGGLDPQNGGAINLFGVNTYIGGTTLTSTGTLTFFNNSKSFSTGAITNSVSATGFAPLLATAPVTLANNWVQGANSGAGINFASSPNSPVTLTGSISMGAKNMNIRNNGGSTSPLTIKGVISGTANFILSSSSNNGSTITLSGANTYTGTTQIGTAAGPSVSVIFGASGTIASTSSIVLAGGTLNPDALNQIMSGTTLGLTAASTIDYGAGGSEVDFANSSGLTWTGPTLNLGNWDSSIDKLRFGLDPSGLTAAQLAKIEFNGNGATLGTAGLDANGFVVVPEPTSLGMLAVGGLTLLGRRRKNA